jgi:hypothetical protein
VFLCFKLHFGWACLQDRVAVWLTKGEILQNGDCKVGFTERDRRTATSGTVNKRPNGDGLEADSHIPWHGMCESNTAALCKSNGKERHGRGMAWYV